ncbi:MAG TPA: thioredoxin domain-containing protein [Solirubrobacteraceae bacterium]|nr:thioredoxin domain-containing protein [Solirubrobacteraceae bacterium]
MSRPAHLLNEDHALTRKQRRERARAERKALERAAVAGAARRTRMTQLAIVVSVVVAGIVAILIATAGSGAVKKIAPETAQARSVDSSVSTLLAGLPQNGNVLGRPTAPVTLEYFGDLECPVCRSFTVNALPSIIGKWVRGGQLRIEYHSLETATREPEVFKSQQVAALAAGKQQKMWNFIETFYHEQGEEDSGYVTEGYIQGIAKQVPGLNLTQWTSERNEPTLAGQVESDAQAANDAGFNGTPSFLIGRSGGAMTKLEPSSYSQAGPFDEAIEKLAKS